MDPLEKILAASAELFKKYGFKTITMDDIARRAGISKKTLYQHFANKNEVVSESLLWYGGQVCNECSAAMSGAADAVEGMLKSMNFFDQIHRQLNPIALLELERFYPEGFKVFKKKILEKDVEVIKQNLLQGIEEGLYRTEINTDFMARYRIEISFLAFNSQFLIENRDDMQRAARLLSEHFMHGIMTPKGVKVFLKHKESI